MWKNFEQNFTQNLNVSGNVTGNFCYFFIIIETISPIQLWSDGGGGKLRFLDFKMLIFKASCYKERNTKLKLHMTTEKQQFYSDALFFDHLGNIYQKNTQI